MGKKDVYVVELDGVSYLYRNRDLSKLDDSQSLDHSIWLITDFENALSKVMTIEGDPKYAHILASRKLQEEGEFDEPITVIPIRKQKRDANSIDLFFSAIPTRVHNQYIDRIKGSNHHILLFPLYTLLDQVLRKVASEHVIAVVFQHERHADMIIGDKKKVYYSGRFVAFDETEEQNQAMWETIHTEVMNIEMDFKINVDEAHIINWLNFRMPSESKGGKKLSFHMVSQEQIDFDGLRHTLSFFYAATNYLSPFHAVMPMNEKIFYLARKITPYALGVMIAVILVFFSGYFWYAGKTKVLSQEISQLEKSYHGITIDVPDPDVKGNFEKTVALIEDLKFNYLAPSFKSVLNDIAEGKSTEMRFETLKLDYTDQALKVETFGRIDIPFEEAYPGYQELIHTLEKKGYRIKESRFDTAIKDSWFLLHFEKKIK